MGSNMQTGLLLVIGTILAAIGWLVLYPGDGDGAAATAQAILNDPTMSKIAVLMGYGGVIAVVIGLFFISRTMALAGGASAAYTSIAMVLFVALVAGFVAGFGLEYGSAEAGSIQEGATLQGVALATGGAIQLVMGIALTLLGIGIAVDKNFHVIAAALLVIAGLALVVSGFVDGDAGDVIEIIAWIGFMLGSLVVGGSSIKSSS
jgi:hypothetical protein